MRLRANRMAWLLCVALAWGAQAFAFPAFREHVVNAEAEVVYAVDAADMNRDGKLDIVGVSATYVAWYENPSWTPHRVVDQLRNDNVCAALHDLDGDGVPEIALGADWQFNNTKGGGALYLLKHGGDPAAKWDVTMLREPVPTLHRVRWADVDGNGAKELIVAPLKGVDSHPPAFTDRPVRLFALFPPDKIAGGTWREETIGEGLHIVHNIWPERRGIQSKDAVLAACAEGVWQYIRQDDGTWTGVNWLDAIGGAPSVCPGAGEIKSAVRIPMYATIEPWHGENVVVYVPRDDTKMASVSYRQVIDNTFRSGHAVGWADLDGDGTEDVFAGHREKAGPNDTYGLYAYAMAVDRSKGAASVTRHAIDVGGMAVEDAVAADINGDGRPDIVAGGRATHNIKYYENKGELK